MLLYLTHQNCPLNKAILTMDGRLYCYMCGGGCPALCVCVCVCVCYFCVSAYCMTLTSQELAVLLRGWLLDEGMCVS